MKQRTRQMQNGDDLAGYAMLGKKNEENEIQLHKLKPQEHYIEAQVQEDDTLQAIALRFYCSLSELKRINHIHKDNEIYARRTIKIPITPYSVLTEMVPTSEAAVPTTSTVNVKLNDPTKENATESPSQNNNNENKLTDFAIDCNEVVMNSTLAPSLIPYTDAGVNEPISEDTHLLPSKEKISVETVVVKQLTSQGADFGIKWFHLVCFLLILGVVIPLVYVMFYLDKPEHSVETPAG